MLAISRMLLGSGLQGKGLSRAWNLVLLVTAVFSGIIVVAMMLTIGYEVVMRYFLNRPTRWVVHFNEYGLVYITFLAAAWVLRNNGHVKIDIVVEKLSGKAKRISEIISYAIGTIVSGAFFWFSLQSTVKAFVLGKFYYKAIDIPQWPIMGVMVLGSLVLTIEFIKQAYQHSLRRAPESK